MLTLARAHGHEHHDLAALFQTLRQLVGGPLQQRVIDRTTGYGYAYRVF